MIKNILIVVLLVVVSHVDAESYAAGFPASFEALGASMTCASSTTGSDGMGDYVQCDGFQVNGMYGPNGITCGPEWSTTESSYTSYANLCQGLGFTGGFQVYYECEASTNRYSFDGAGWSITGDNGYVKNIKCYGYVAPDTTAAPEGEYGGSHWVIKGHSGTGCNEPDGCAPYMADDSEIHKVRCCSDIEIDGWTTHCGIWHTSQGCESLNFMDAEAHCEGLGGRLCTKEEVENNCAIGDGCNHDNYLIWTSDPQDEDVGFAAGFPASFEALGATMTCASSTTGSDGMGDYVQCDGFQVNGMYGPNGITCGPTWSTTESSYTSYASLCQGLGFTGGFQVYYECEASTTRYSFDGYGWSTTGDNGYVKNIKCYGYVAPEPDCAGVVGGDAVVDQCGVCGGDSSTCADCAGVPNGNAALDECGVCNGDGSSCADCAGVPNGNAVEDECGVCEGSGGPCGYGNGFPPSFEALGASMTCASSSTGSDGMGDYVQCDGFQVNGMYGPNGITCGPTWSTTESSYTSYASLCQGLGFTGGFSVYYECEASTTRYSFDGYGWSTTGDNGYVKNIKCYGYVAPETTSAPTTTAEPTTTTAEPTTTTAEPTTTTAEPTTTTAEPTTTAAPECTDFTEKKPCKKAKKTHPPLKCTWHKSINQCQADDWEPVCSEFTEKKPCKKMGCTWDKKTSSCGGEEECIMAWGEVAELVTMNGKVKHKNIDSAEDCVDLAVSLGGMGIEYDETSSKGLCWTYTKVKEFVEGSSSDGMTVLVNKCS